MDSFTWIAPLVSMVLGLGVARLMTDFINAVRARRASRIDWVPLAWALSIFIAQIQFWWAFGQLAEIKPEWEFLEFLVLVGFTMMLFASGAQLLPTSDKEREMELRIFFAESGRWALVTLAAYYVLSAIMNVVFFETRLMAPWFFLDVVMIALTLITFFSKSSRVQQIATALFLAVHLFDAVVMSDPRLFEMVG